MFNSQKINNDLEPWFREFWSDYDREWKPSARYATEQGAQYINGLLWHHQESRINYHPRPEFDNNPNPILEHFRDAMSSGEYDAIALATVWVSLIDTGYDWEEDGLVPTLEQLYHARKVLERLAALTER